MGETRARFDGVEVSTLVIFGDEGTPALLGAYTLEGLGLAVDPENRRLVPTTAYLLGSVCPSADQSAHQRTG